MEETARELEKSQQEEEAREAEEQEHRRQEEEERQEAEKRRPMEELVKEWRSKALREAEELGQRDADDYRRPRAFSSVRPLSREEYEAMPLAELRREARLAEPVSLEIRIDNTPLVRMKAHLLKAEQSVLEKVDREHDGAKQDAEQAVKAYEEWRSMHWARVWLHEKGLFGSRTLAHLDEEAQKCQGKLEVWSEFKSEQEQRRDEAEDQKQEARDKARWNRDYGVALVYYQELELHEQIKSVLVPREREEVQRLEEARKAQEKQQRLGERNSRIEAIKTASEPQDRYPSAAEALICELHSYHREHGAHTDWREADFQAVKTLILEGQNEYGVKRALLKASPHVAMLPEDEKETYASQTMGAVLKLPEVQQELDQGLSL